MTLKGFLKAFELALESPQYTLYENTYDGMLRFRHHDEPYCFCPITLVYHNQTLKRYYVSHARDVAKSYLGLDVSLIWPIISAADDLRMDAKRYPNILEVRHHLLRIVKARYNK